MPDSLLLGFSYLGRPCSARIVLPSKRWKRRAFPIWEYSKGWSHQSFQGNALLEILPQYCRWHSLIEPSLWCHRQPLRSSHHQRWHWAPLRGCSWLLSILHICSYVGCCQRKVPHKFDQRHWERWMDSNVAEIKRGRTFLWVPIPIKGRWCCSNDMAGCGQKGPFHENEDTQVQEILTISYGQQ